MTTQPNDPTTPTLATDDQAAIERGLAAEERDRKAAAKPAAKKAAKQPAKKPAAKKIGNAKKATAQNAAPRSHVSATALGEEIAALAKKAGKAKGASAVTTLAGKLAKGTLNHGWLVSLRDAVNALAAELRDENQKALAKQLTAANRAVRRLERRTRAEGAV